MNGGIANAVDDLALLIEHIVVLQQSLPDGIVLLLNFLLRAIACGATDRAEASAATGLSAELLDGRPFRSVLSA